MHAAARVHVMDEPEGDPLEAFREGVRGTLRLARQAAEAGVRRFVFVSSVKVNGEETPTGRPFREADTPAPEDLYGVSKREAKDGLQASKAGLRARSTISRDNPASLRSHEAVAKFEIVADLPNDYLLIEFPPGRPETPVLEVG